MRRENNRITGFQGNQRLVDNRRGRVGGRHQRANNAERHAHVHHFFLLIVMNDADGLHIFDGVVNAQRGKTVLQDFILPVAEAGLFRGHFRQRFGMVRRFLGHVFHDGVDLLL